MGAKPYPPNLEKVYDEGAYRYRIYDANGWCCRVYSQGRDRWTAVRLMDNHHFRSTTLFGLAEKVARASS